MNRLSEKRTDRSGGKRKRRTAYRSGRLELIGFVSPLKSLSLDGNKTRRKISPEAKRKLDRNPLARKSGLRFKSWRKW